MLHHKLYDPLLSLPELYDQLSQRSKAFRDDYIQADQMTVDADTGSLFIKDGHMQSYPLQTQALEHLAVKLRIPATYLHRCPPHLIAFNINHWLAGLRGKPLLIRFDGNMVRAILSPSYVPLSNLELIAMLMEMADSQHLSLHVRYEWSETRFVAQIVEVGRDLAIPGDTILGGLQVMNSETGGSSLLLSALIYRLVCTNGMTVTDELALRRVHRRDPRELTQELHATTGAIFERLPTLATPLRQLAGQAMPNPMEAITSLVKRHQLSETQQQRIEAAWRWEPGESRIFLLHAITRAANDSELSLDERTQLQALGGELLQLNAG